MNIGGLQISIGGRRRGGGTAAPFAPTLDLNYTSRSGLSLTEASGLNATIIPACGNITATTYLLRTMADFAVGDSSGYLEARVYWNGSSKIYIFASSDQGSVTRYVRLYVWTDGKAYFNVIVGADTRTYRTDDALSIGWHIIRLTSNGTAYSFTVDGSVVAGTATAGTNDGKWFDFCTLRDNITIGALKHTSVIASDQSYIDYVDYNNTNKWILSGAGSVEYDVLGGLHMTWVGTGYGAFDINAGTHFLNVGFSLYKHPTTGVFHYVPYTSAGTPYNASAYETTLGYVKIADYAGDSANLILGFIDQQATVPFLIGFNEGGSADSKLEIFDRSNITRQEDISRTSVYYNAASLATKCRYHSSEILYLAAIEPLFKDGYKHRIFPVNDDVDYPTKVIGFMVTQTDLS